MLRQYFLQLFAEKLTKTPKHGSLFEKLLVLAKSMIFRAFSRNDSLFAQNFIEPNMVSKSCKFCKIDDFSFLQEKRHFLQLFSENRKDMVVLTWKSCKFRKVEIDDFSCFFTKWGTVCNFFLKTSSKCQNMVVCSKSCKAFGQIDDFSCFLTKRGTFCNCMLKTSSKRQTW